MISVIIPSCNRVDLLSKCLDLLSPESQTIDSSDYEVIVSDDSTGILTKTLVSKYKWAKWVEGPGRGPAANRNNGFKHAAGDWLVFIDDDCLPDKNILKNYQIACATHPEKQVFEGAILPDNWDLLKKDMSECPVNTEGSCFWSANVCIEKTLFEQVKGFDENYLIAAQEDQQLKIDIESFTKQEITFLKQCIVIHPVRFSNVIRQLKRIPVLSKNFSIYALKNRERLNYHSDSQFCLDQYSFHLRKVSQSLKSRKFKNATVSLAWLIYGIPLNMINVSLLKSGNRTSRLS